MPEQRRDRTAGRVAREDEVGASELTGEHLPHRAPVLARVGDPAVRQEVVTDQVLDEGGTVDDVDDAGQRQARVHRATRVRPELQRPHDRQWFAADGQREQGRAPPARGVQPQQRRDQVLAQCAGQADVLELHDLVLDQAARVADDPPHHPVPTGQGQVVADDDSPRHIGQDSHHGDIAGRGRRRSER